MQIICIRWEYVIYNIELFVLKMITWSYYCLRNIIIIITYLKPETWRQRNDYN